MIDQARLDHWRPLARRDDWHMLFVGSDIREMLGEIERLSELWIAETRENERLRSIVRVNGLRWGHTHTEIDAILDPEQRGGDNA
jgi:hypothetical protein